MRTIKLSTAKRQAKTVKKAIEPFHDMSQKAKSMLVKKGFKYCALGTGKQSYTSSKDIDIRKLDNTYLTGQYLIIGCANKGNSKGCTYYGLVKRIEN